MDRDENSSINIMSRYLSQNGLWTAYQRFVDNLRQTGIVLVGSNVTWGGVVHDKHQK